MSKKNKNNHPSTELESDESNHQKQSTEVLDLSLLRKPIATSVTGFEEVLRAYEAGTNELRKLLSRECDLIYECKTCRNIYRSLTNFISHKRVYCRSSFNTSEHFHFRNNGFVEQDISTIIDAEQEINNNPNGINGILPGTDERTKDLSGIVERLLWKQHQSRTSNLNDFYDQIQQPVTKNTQSEDGSQRSQRTLKLNRVGDSDIAVYQSLQMDNENSSMKDEINEVHKMRYKSNNTVLGPDGKVLNLFKAASTSSSPAPPDLEMPFICQICSLPFETEKTLKVHVEMKHLPSSFVYQCPSCSKRFSSTAAVIRHLGNDHKKSNRRIRVMRDNIVKKRMRADEVVQRETKAPSVSREVQKLRDSNGGTEQAQDDSNNDWNQNDLSGDYQNDAYTCPSCFKKFERKTVYTNHVQACTDAKQPKVKAKRAKTKDSTKVKRLLLPPSIESEENSNASDQSINIHPEVLIPDPLPPPAPVFDENTNKRKRKRINKVKKEIKKEPETNDDEVDWNLDDEEEKKKLDNIKKEIIEDDYKKNQEEASSTMNLSIANELKLDVSAIEPMQENLQDDDDDDDSGLIIDEKPVDDDSAGAFKCPQCDKVLETPEKLKYHLTCYHSRQKRFKCKMCEYQGYRKKDTINHLNYVHQIEGDKERLESLMESVIKAVDEESLAKQSELKKTQLKIKRKMARDKLKAGEAKELTLNVAIKTEPEESKSVQQKAPEPERIKPQKIRRKSLHTSILVPSETGPSDDGTLKIPKMFIKTKFIEKIVDENNEAKSEKSPKRRHSANRPTSASPSSRSLLNISRYGKIVKTAPGTVGPGNGSSKTETARRPIRNRIKPVNKDFLYDLSDLLKKEADAYREQVHPTAPVTIKRELRKRVMSTHTREMPDLSTFDDPETLNGGNKPELNISTPAVPLFGDMDDDIPLVKLKDPRNRRMSVFALPSPRQSYQSITVPKSPAYKPPEPLTSKSPNVGTAYKIAVREFDANRASLYEPKFLWSICFDEGQKRPAMPSVALNTSSAASSILHKLSGGVKAQNEEVPETPAGVITKSRSLDEKSMSTLTAEQLCKKFEMINVTSISENELDIPSMMNPEGDGLMALALKTAEHDSDVCVLQEIASDEEDDKPSSSSASDVNTKKKKKTPNTKRAERKLRKISKGSEKGRKSCSSAQRRLTVMQRLQENKIRKSREALFKRLLENQQNSDGATSSTTPATVAEENDAGES